LLDDVGGLAAKAVASDDRDALTMTGMEAIVDRRFGRVLMSSMLLVCETQQLPTTPRQYREGPWVLAQSGIGSFPIQTLDLCDLVSH